jgi:hypothetical protein
MTTWESVLRAASASPGRPAGIWSAFLKEVTANQTSTGDSR